MKQLLNTIAAVVLVGCGESQQSAPQAEPVEPVAEVPVQPSPPPAESKPTEPVDEASQPEPPTAKAPDISIYAATRAGNTEVVKQHLATGTDVNARNNNGYTPLHWAAVRDRKEIAELLIAAGADVNAKILSGKFKGETPLNFAKKVTADLLRKNGGKTKEELEAAGN